VLSDAPPFLISALPRSRTAWLAAFLSTGGWTCHHQVAVRMRSIPDMVRFFQQPCTGAAETAVSLGWMLFRYYLPELRTVVIRRPVEECVASMLRVDVAAVAVYNEGVLRHGLTREAAALDALAEQPDVLAVDYADLAREDACAAVFEHCLPFPFPRARWLEMRERNIQADVKGLLRYYQANRVALDRFKADCKAELARLARAGMIVRRQRELI